MLADFHKRGDPSTMPGPITVSECETQASQFATFDIMHQLRPRLKEQTYPDALDALKADGARLIAAYMDGDIVGCAVFRVEFRLAYGRMVYVDDLVTDTAMRSAGIGATLLDWISSEAKLADAELVVLDSGVHRGSAHRFYFREGFEITSFSFKKRL